MSYTRKSGSRDINKGQWFQCLNHIQITCAGNLDSPLHFFYLPKQLDQCWSPPKLVAYRQATREGIREFLDI